MIEKNRGYESDFHLSLSIILKGISVRKFFWSVKKARKDEGCEWWGSFKERG